MSYELSNNPDTIYVPVDKFSPSMAIIVVACVFLLVALFNGMSFLRRVRALHNAGLTWDRRTKTRGVATLIGAAGLVLAVVFYGYGPFFHAEQERNAQVAIEDIRDRYGLEARWEFSPYNPFFGQDQTRVGRLYVTVDGRDYHVRVSPTEYTVDSARHGTKVKKDQVVLACEVLTDQGYVPIHEFADQVGVSGWSNAWDNFAALHALTTSAARDGHS